MGYNRPHFLLHLVCWFVVFIIMLCTVGMPQPAHAAPPGPFLVKDINNNTLSSTPANFVSVNDMLYFTANDGVHGQELWKSDGTEAGTVLVKDINVDADGDSEPSAFTNVEGILYFSAYDSVYGSELWKSDGTEAGTVLVKDINVEPGGGSGPSSLTNVEGILYFIIYGGMELWKSDGTEIGTVLVKTLNLGGYPQLDIELCNVNGKLFFTINDGNNGAELWKSDGTEAGTVLVKDINPGSDSSDPSELVNVNGILYFSAYDGDQRKLWKSDGTEAGTVIVKEITVGGPKYPTRLTHVNGLLYFSAFNNDSSTDVLWQSDGTTAGTVIIKSSNENTLSYPFGLTNVNGMLYFGAYSGNQNGLWKSDGTAAGTQFLKGFLLEPSLWANVNGTLYLLAQDSNFTQSGLWKSDGTAAGTVFIKDIRFGDGFPGWLTTVGEGLFFSAHTSEHGFELWKSDGTTTGTNFVKDINKTSPGSEPTDLVDVDGTLYFQANDGQNGWELWKSNGTEEGTRLVKNISPGNFDAFPHELTNVNGMLYFVANDDEHGAELWKSDGTETGTVLVKDINSGSPNWSPAWLTNLNSNLYFTAEDDVAGTELWKSDGTEAGTVLVKDINPDGYAHPADLLVVNDMLYFTADDGVHGRDLWKSDGTAAGTVLVKDFHPSDEERFTELTAVGDLLYFRADDGVSGYGLWKSDGTEAGTVRVNALSYPSDLTNVNGTLYFLASEDYDRGLWQIEQGGTTAILVKELVSNCNCPFSTGPFFTELTAVNDILYFITWNRTNGVEERQLWLSDGTEAGTKLVKDTWMNEVDLSSPLTNQLTNMNGTLYFVADDGVAGRELWQSDGTVSGTMLVKDINPGNGSSSPTQVTPGDSMLYFVADDGHTGTELWALPTHSATFHSIQLNTEGYSTTEIDTQATITVTRVGNAQGIATVAYATSDGTASAGVDYIASSGVITFAAGKTKATFTVPILDDALLEGNETISLTLSTPSGGAELGVETSQLTIMDQEADLAVTTTITASTTSIDVGTILTYTTKITNHGPSPALSVTFTGTLPANVQLLSAIIRGTCTGVGTITCAMGTLKSGDTMVISQVVRLIRAGSISNTVTVSSKMTDPNAVNNRTTTDISVQGQIYLPLILK